MQVRKMLERMESEGYTMPAGVAVSSECVDMLRGLLQPKPEARLSLEAVLDHPWFVKKLPPQVRGCGCGCRCRALFSKLVAGGGGFLCLTSVSHGNMVQCTQSGGSRG